MKGNGTYAAIAVAAALALSSCGGAGGGGDCPDEDAIQASIRHYIADISWSPGEREIWKVADVTGFSFGSTKTGRLIDKQVEWGKPAQPVCPVRVQFDYKVIGVDGSVKDKHEGDNQTYLFYRNAFDEWVYKVESG